MNPTYIILHTVALRRDVELKEIDQWHRLRGFASFGYHYYIRRDGRIEQGRKEYKVGAHCRAAGRNRDSIGICFEGHGDLDPWSPEQDRALRELYKDILSRRVIPVKNIYGHREFDPLKTCPGSLINMDDVRKDLTQEFERCEVSNDE